mmetsp:Transcript_36810/g.72396  ORF Transcript_36810/g.72396 Transcript_36810/m.72396 type:complete len:108 (-) Transcript_36810:24-347(-)
MKRRREAFRTASDREEGKEGEVSSPLAKVEKLEDGTAGVPPNDLRPPHSASLCARNAARRPHANTCSAFQTTASFANVLGVEIAKARGDGEVDVVVREGSPKGHSLL